MSRVIVIAEWLEAEAKRRAEREAAAMHEYMSGSHWRKQPRGMSLDDLLGPPPFDGAA